MRATFVLVLCSLAILSGTSDVGSEPAAEKAIAFGLPFKCSTTEEDESKSAVGAAKNCDERCLADSFKPGLSVALLGEAGICTAKTGDMCSFSFSHGPGGVTQLVGAEKCLAVRDDVELFKKHPFYIAVVGVDPAAVRIVLPNDDHSPLPKDAILWARQILDSLDLGIPASEPQLPGYRVSSPPQMLRVKNVVLFKFEFVRESHGHERALVLLVNNRLFRLGRHGCPGEYTFFTVNDKLHITFWDGSCGAGIVDKVVYDLSSGRPKLLYHNGVFGD